MRITIRANLLKCSLLHIMKISSFQHLLNRNYSQLNKCVYKHFACNDAYIREILSFPPCITLYNEIDGMKQCEILMFNFLFKFVFFYFELRLIFCNVKRT